jgi:glutamate/aspartate transport system substrate-binding protein
MSRTILDGDAERLYKKWFQQPIPPNGVKLDIPMSFLLRDSFKFPTDKVAD